MWIRTTNPGVPDLFLEGLGNSRSLYVDVEISVAPLYPRAAARPGAVAKEQERLKRLKYPVFNAEGRRRVMHDFEPFALEAHGRWGHAAVRLVRRLASMRALAIGVPVSQEVARWYAHISVALMRCNAKLLRGRLGDRPRHRWQSHSGYRDLTRANN